MERALAGFGTVCVATTSRPLGLSTLDRPRAPFRICLVPYTVSTLSGVNFFFVAHGDEALGHATVLMKMFTLGKRPTLPIYHIELRENLKIDPTTVVSE